MSYGKDERHIDKNVWKLPIPRYDNTDGTHRRIAELANALTELVSSQSGLPQYFVTLRQRIMSDVAPI